MVHAFKAFFGYNSQNYSICKRISFQPFLFQKIICKASIGISSELGYLEIFVLKIVEYPFKINSNWLSSCKIQSNAPRLF